MEQFSLCSPIRTTEELGIRDIERGIEMEKCKWKRTEMPRAAVHVGGVIMRELGIDEIKTDS